MAKKKLKLYIWDDVLCDYTGGVAFALASSPEEAKAMLVQQLGDHRWDGLQLDGQDYCEYDEPVASYCYGSS